MLPFLMNSDLCQLVPDSRRPGLCIDPEAVMTCERVWFRECALKRFTLKHTTSSESRKISLWQRHLCFTAKNAPKTETYYVTIDLGGKGYRDLRLKTTTYRRMST